MTRFAATPARARNPVVMGGLMLACAALTLATTGCTKKQTLVDPSYSQPEGVSVPDARLLLKSDIPITYLSYFDRLNVGGPTPSDTLFTTPHDTLESGHIRLGIFQIYESSPGAIGGEILDHTPASSYQALRRESGGGFRVLQKSALIPIRRWLDSEWEAYLFTDPAPSSFQPPTYIARGLFAGAVTSASPLSNRSLLVPTSFDTLFFDYQGRIDPNDFIDANDSTYTPPDSIFGLHWAQVSGAAGYWIQIFQFTGDAFEQVRSSAPAPLYLNKSRDFFVGFVPAPADSYRLGTPGADVLTRRTLLNHQDYFARISAVDGTGRLLAYTYGRPTRVPGGVRNTWSVFWRGAIRIRPGPILASAPSSRVGTSP